MGFKRLEKNLIDIIKEEQAKLGYRKESIRLYYPLGSLKHLLKADADIEKMREVLDDFCDEVKEFFGQIEVTMERDFVLRYLMRE